MVRTESAFTGLYYLKWNSPQNSSSSSTATATCSFPACSRRQEIKALTDEVPALYAQRRPENVREKTGDAVRTNFAAHLYS